MRSWNMKDSREQLDTTMHVLQETHRVCDNQQLKLEELNVPNELGGFVISEPIFIHSKIVRNNGDMKYKKITNLSIQ